MADEPVDPGPRMDQADKYLWTADRVERLWRGGWIRQSLMETIVERVAALELDESSAQEVWNEVEEAMHAADDDLINKSQLPEPLVRMLGL